MANIVPDFSPARPPTGMTRLSHPTLAFIAGADVKNLAAQIAYLKAENELLRKRQPKRILLEAN